MFEFTHGLKFCVIVRGIYIEQRIGLHSGIENLNEQF